MDQFVLDRALLSGEQQDEILFALQAIRATGGGEEALSRLSALFRREGATGWRWIFPTGAAGRRSGRIFPG